jgi:hypothetical protein
MGPRPRPVAADAEYRAALGGEPASAANRLCLHHTFRPKSPRLVQSCVANNSRSATERSVELRKNRRL